MDSNNPFGYKDHRPFLGFSDELIYGVAEDGRHIHITEAERGLKCQCRCPACDRVVLAKKGKKLAHHFAHSTKGAACSHVAETNAHIWAKEVLEQEKNLNIPAIYAEHDGRREIVSAAKTYEFAHARLEKRLGTIVPDVVLVTDGGAQLIVEVRVTHACEDAKLETLRRENLSAIEIDLRKYRLSTDREAIEDALLKTAPRDWLNNAKKELFDERLRDRIVAETKLRARKAQERAERAAREEKRRADLLAEQIEKTARGLVDAVRSGKICREVPSFAQEIIDEFEDVYWCDMNAIGFNVRDVVWQAELVAHYLTYPNALDYQIYEETTLEAALKVIDHDLIDAFKRTITDPVRHRLKEDGEARDLPIDAVEAFFNSLVDAGYLVSGSSSSYYVSESHIDRLCKRERLREAYERRRNDLLDRLGIVIGRLPSAERVSFSAEHWFVTPVSHYAVTPEDICRSGGDVFRELDRALKRIELMSEGGPATEELLGLPLFKEVERAQDRERENAMRAASNRRESLVQAARSELAEEAGEWLSGPSEYDEELARIDQAGIDDLSYQRLRASLTNASLARRARIRARQEVLERQAALRDAASKVFDPGHLDLFLRSTQPKLGRSPLEYCVDARTLRECLALLPSGRRGRQKPK